MPSEINRVKNMEIDKQNSRTENPEIDLHMQQTLKYNQSDVSVLWKNDRIFNDTDRIGYLDTKTEGFYVTQVQKYIQKD